MKKVLRIIFIISFWACSLLIFGFWVVTLKMWLGFFGVVLAFMLSPGILIFPFIFWIVEGVFPVLYFILWGINISTGLIGYLIFKDE